MTRVIIESDAQNLVRAAKSSDFDLAPEGVVYRDIRSCVNHSFSSACCVHCSRTCNKVAHTLAALGASSEAIVPTVDG
jgi:hypothetical protein